MDELIPTLIFSITLLQIPCLQVAVVAHWACHDLPARIADRKEDPETRSLILLPPSPSCFQNHENNGALNYMIAQSKLVLCRAVQVIPLDWGAPGCTALPDKREVVVGADVLYNPSSIGALVDTLVQLLRPSAPITYTPLAYLGVCKRNPATYEKFLHALEGAKLVFEVLDCPQPCVEFFDVLEDCLSELFILRIS